MRRKSTRTIPVFRSEEEEASFWGTHDSADYWRRFEDAAEPIEVDPALALRIDRRSRRKQLISIRLEIWQIRLAKAIAIRERIPYHTVIRRWIEAGIPRKRATS